MSIIKDHNMGGFIKRMRMERGITQERLCAGLCDISTLSRIERGLITPANDLFQAIMERLGCYSDRERLEFFRGDNSESAQRKRALDIAITREDLSLAERLVRELENEKSFAGGLGLQFILNRKISIMGLKGEIDGKIDLDNFMALLRRTIFITLPDFGEEGIADYMLTSEEIQTISMMGGAYYCVGDYERAARVQLALKENLDKFSPNKYEKTRHYPGILTNIALLFYKLGRYDEGVAMCELGRNYCVECNDFIKLPSLLNIYSRCLAESGRLDEARSMLLDVYFSARAFGVKDLIDSSGAYFYETFGESAESAAPSILGHTCGQVNGQVSVQVREKAKRLLAALGEETLSAKELMGRLGAKHRQSFRDNHLRPALAAGLVEMTSPDKPRSSAQKYRAAKRRA